MLQSGKLLLLPVRTMLMLLVQNAVFALEPSFRVPEINVTVVEGQTAKLPCSVHSLGDHKVVWTDNTSFLLTLNDRRIVDDERISIERPMTKDWNLHIRKVTYADRGRYICQINTTPVKNKMVALHVLVTPTIIEDLSSRNISVKEGETVTLVCNATGVPQPEVTWFRLSNNAFQKRERIGSAGEMLIIHNVSRDCAGTYECQANNGLEEVASRKKVVDVQYAPEVNLPVARIGQYPGKETFLECKITARPHGVMYWSKNGVDVATMDQAKYTMELFLGNEQDQRVLSLRIKDISAEEYGRYTCHAQTFLGRDEASMIVYDYTPIEPKQPKTTTVIDYNIPGHLTSTKPSAREDGPFFPGRPYKPETGPANSIKGETVGALGGGNFAVIIPSSFFLPLCIIFPVFNILLL